MAQPEHAPTLATPVCVDFEDLALGASYGVGDTFVDSGTVVTGHPFVWSDGTPYSGGFAQFDNGGLAGGSDLELAVNNINLDVDFGAPLTGLSFRFGEYGGNVNIESNGDFVNVDNFGDLDGATIGGAAVSVVNGLGNDKGRLQLDGVCPETFPERVRLPAIMGDAPST